MKDPYYFSPFSDYQKFCNRLKVGSLIDYSISFDPKTLIDMFKSSGIELNYMVPGTTEYEAFGSTIMKVLNIKNKTESKPVLFDTKMLDL